MKPPSASGDPSRDLEAIQSELDRLDKRDAQLQAALEDIEHDTRRCNDALERAGSRSGEAEARSTMLDENRRVIAADRQSNEALRRESNSRLALTRKRLQETEHVAHPEFAFA